jgi:hypothetical protein
VQKSDALLALIHPKHGRPQLAAALQMMIAPTSATARPRPASTAVSSMTAETRQRDHGPGRQADQRRDQDGGKADRQRQAHDAEQVAFTFEEQASREAQGIGLRDHAGLWRHQRAGRNSARLPDQLPPPRPARLGLEPIAASLFALEAAPEFGPELVACADRFLGRALRRLNIRLCHAFGRLYALLGPRQLGPELADFVLQLRD